MFYTKYIELCRKFHMTPSYAATKAGFSKGTVSVWRKKYDSGIDVRPEKDVLEKICAFFGCSESWLLDIEEAPSGEGCSPAMQRIMDSLAGMSEEQLDKIYTVIQSVRSLM